MNLRLLRLKKIKAMCDKCTVYTCVEVNPTRDAPLFCSTKNYEDVLKEVTSRYKSGEDKVLAKAVKSVNTRSNRRWPRIKETIEFAKEIGAKRIGLAFCIGLKDEAKLLCQIFEAHDLEVFSVCCQVGHRKLLDQLISENEPILCNPIAQAEILNKNKTDLNILFGLCVGDDALFSKYSNALVTTLVVKDKVLCHNPIGPLTHAYTYYKDKLPTKKGVKIHPDFI